MSVAFCTIITRSHLPWALALQASLERHQQGLHFVVLVTDAQDLELPEGASGRITLMSLADLRDDGVGDAIRIKYASQPDELRWSLKPILLLKLLERHAKVLYGDCDLHFFAPIGMLLEQLDSDRMLLSPHWRWSRPDGHTREFIELMTSGLFNGGFVAANARAREPLEHWAGNCLAMCVIDRSRGQFVDQTHLNVLPIHHEGVGIIRHRGCNLAFWNRRENVRGLDAEGQVRINGIYPVVFIHFTKSTVRSIITGEDPLLLPYLESFNAELLRFGIGYSLKDRILAEAEAEKAALALEKQHSYRPTLLQRVRFHLNKLRQ